MTIFETNSLRNEGHSNVIKSHGGLLPIYCQVKTPIHQMCGLLLSCTDDETIPFSGTKFTKNRTLTIEQNLVVCGPKWHPRNLQCEILNTSFGKLAKQTGHKF